MGFNSEQQPYYITNNKKITLSTLLGEIVIKVELDFVNRKYNLYLNNHLAADFVEFSDITKECITSWSVAAKKGMKIEHVWGVSYKRLTENEFEPFSIQTFIDEDFTTPVQIQGCSEEDYDNSRWKKGILPIVHGGERYAGQDILMRKKVFIDKVPPYAELYIESLTPGGELYINGELAEFIKDEYTGDWLVNNSLSAFSPQVDPISTEVANLSQTMVQYLQPIQIGMAPDVDEAFTTLDTQLKAAGIEKVMTELQSQVDTYLGK